MLIWTRFIVNELWFIRYKSHCFTFMSDSGSLKPIKALETANVEKIDERALLDQF